MRCRLRSAHDRAAGLVSRPQVLAEVLQVAAAAVGSTRSFSPSVRKCLLQDVFRRCGGEEALADDVRSLG